MTSESANLKRTCHCSATGSPPGGGPRRPAAATAAAASESPRTVHWQWQWQLVATLGSASLAASASESRPNDSQGPVVSGTATREARDSRGQALDSGDSESESPRLEALSICTSPLHGGGGSPGKGEGVPATVPGQNFPRLRLQYSIVKKKGRLQFFTDESYAHCKGNRCH
jgi:hypothetical protein